MNSNLRQCFFFLFFYVFVMMSLAEATILLSDQRQQWEEQGVAWEIVYTGEYWDNARGGLKEDNTYLGNLDVSMTLDTTALGWWKNGTFFIYGLDNHGGDKLTGSILGDTQAASNIEAPRTSRLYEIWYEHLLWDEQLSVLLGIHDYNSEFAVTEYGGLFINSSFGLSADVASSSRSSVFPLAAPAVRTKWMPNDQFEWLLGVYDGDPGDPEIDEHHPRSTIDGDQGVFIASEWVYHTVADRDGPALPGSYKLGLWYNTGEFNDVVDVDASGNAVVRDGNGGVYGVVDQMLYREKDNQGLSGFLQIGGNQQALNEVDFYIGGGLHYRGLIDGRDDDEAGIAVAYASISDDITDVGGRDDAETVVELTYRLQVNEDMVIQPDVQYVIDPGADPALKNAMVVGLRFQINL